jgi:hypothetical protein
MTSSTGPASFGRVDDDGTVHVRTADGERAVGQIPDVSADEALAFYVRRYEALEVEVRLLVTRVGSGAISPEEARNSIKAVRTSVASANAVGDLDGLLVQLDGLAPVLEVQSEARRAERARQHEQTKAKKEQMVAEAEVLAEGNDWRGGVNRFRALLDEWKALPRIDRATDDDLWHRFSAARTTYTRRRKAQFAEQAAKRDTAKEAKERIIAEARALATSTDWGPTAGEFRDLMTRWKAVGPAPREVDDALWAEFRGLTSSSPPGSRSSPSRTPSSRATSRPRRNCSRRPRPRCCPSPTWPQPRPPSAASWRSTTRSARCPGSRSARSTDG